jgi:multimeric flavodoxin WrbA
MKVLFLNGSPRKKGATATLLYAVADGVSSVGDMSGGKKVEWIDVYNLEIRPCRGCLRCRPAGACILPADGAHRVGRLIHEADVLVVGTPTYWGNMSGSLKTLFDRLVPAFEFIGEGLPRPVQKGKKAAIVVTSSTPWPLNQLLSQSRGAVRAVRTVLHSGGYRIVGTINLPGKPGQPREVPERALRQARQLGKTL